MKFLTFWYLIFRTTAADYLAFNAYPSLDCQGTAYFYLATNILPCSQRSDSSYESIICKSSNSWVRNIYSGSSCTSLTSTENGTGNTCSNTPQVLAFGRSSSYVCIAGETKRPTSGIVFTSIYRKDTCSQPPISFNQISRDVCIYQSVSDQGAKFVCDDDAMRWHTYSYPDCLGEVIELWSSTMDVI